jgi:hypothetical protein
MTFVKVQAWILVSILYILSLKRKYKRNLAAYRITNDCQVYIFWGHSQINEWKVQNEEMKMLPVSPFKNMKINIWVISLTL